MTTRTPKLSDMQLILLATACQRDDGSLLPPPDSIGTQTDRIRKAVASLIKHNLAEESEASDAASIWREDCDIRFGVVITDAGRTIIAAAEAEPVGSGGVLAPEPPATAPSKATHNYGRRLVKIIELMERPEGATLGDMVAATGLLPHSVRAALSGLRKRQMSIIRENHEQGSVYRIVKAEA